MAALNDQQIYFIEQSLSESRLQYKPLREELLDHLCCSVEEYLEAGYTFRQSTEMAFALFSDKELETIEKQTLFLIHKKPRIMKALSLIVFTLLLAIPSIHWINTEAPPTISPLDSKYRISSGFGWRMHPILKKKKMHMGVDFIAPIGTPVKTTSDGLVLKVEEDKEGYGKYIIIKHDDQYSTLYAQLEEVKVSIGQQVKLGEVIGTVGSSGRSTGPHLHYEVRVNGTHQDPEEYFRP